MPEESNTPNAPALPPFTVAVIHTAYGSIGVHAPLKNCERCGAETRDLANVGTPMSALFVCRACRAEAEAA